MTVRDIELAKLSNWIYKSDDPQTLKTVIPSGFELKESSLKNASGYAGALVQKTSTKEYIFVHRGTDQLSDWVTNAGFTVGLDLQGIDRDRFLYGKVLPITSFNFQTTGHSQGGFHAQFMGGLLGVKATCFNPAGAAQSLRSAGVNINQAFNKITNYIVTSDGVPALVPSIGNNVYIKGTASSLSLNPLKGGIIGSIGANELKSHSMDNFINGFATTNNKGIYQTYETFWDAYCKGTASLDKFASDIADRPVSLGKGSQYWPTPVPQKGGGGGNDPNAPTPSLAEDPAGSNNLINNNSIQDNANLRTQRESLNDPSIKDKELYDPVVQEFMKNYPNRKGVIGSYEQYIYNSNKPKSNKKLPPVASQPFNRVEPFRTPNAEAISKTLYAANTYFPPPPYSSTIDTSHQYYYREEASYYYDGNGKIYEHIENQRVPISPPNSGDSPVGEFLGSLLAKAFKAIFHGW